MSSIQAAGDQNLNTRIVAFFKSKEAAYRAVSELHNAGFTSAEIGIIESREREAHPTGTEYASRDNESLWEKIKDFFRGESYDDDIAYDQSTEGMHWDRNRANYYYQGITRGGALVSVSGIRQDSCPACGVMSLMLVESALAECGKGCVNLVEN